MKGYKDYVVICFKIRIFALRQTSMKSSFGYYSVL